MHFGQILRTTDFGPPFGYFESSRAARDRPRLYSHCYGMDLLTLLLPSPGTGLHEHRPAFQCACLDGLSRNTFLWFCAQ